MYDVGLAGLSPLSVDCTLSFLNFDTIDGDTILVVHEVVTTGLTNDFVELTINSMKQFALFVTTKQLACNFSGPPGGAAPAPINRAPY